jgi:alpha-glucosidase (family GH31 glycosyl hydrolase)
MDNNIPKHFQIDAHPVADPRAVVVAPKARFSVLTPCLFRMEFSPSDQFEDRPSQVFWHREQPVPVFEVKHSDTKTEIITEYLHLKFQHGDGFSPQTLSITIQRTGKTWHYGDAVNQNLKGTGRTLDGIDGSIPLDDGLLSRSGWKLVDDSKGLVFNQAGWLEPRNALDGYLDLYFFGYGHDYQENLRDYYRISGNTPMIPRWVLGNWWSRFWEFTQEELGNLMMEFKQREVPLSVCIIDMDWHITDIGKWPGGWTGYTWNQKLFPDYKGFIKFLHEMGLRTALNLHPASGVLSHEAMYPQMAEAMGIDPETREPVKFDLENPKFLNPYFDYLHHPSEADGIDFWWMDWQQGNPSSLGLNLLWWINHIHFLDLGREKEKRPFVFSRWGGLGNHRYPIGFSGDTVITWKSLAFQPYMTAAAANVGFGWWSHDIGGHMNGIQEAELYTRWVQFGVFSPILRLHSTKNPFLERRPWGYDEETFRITKSAMQFRHALIPYLYSMAWRDHSQGIPLIRPMYHLLPENEEAYSCPNQYAFGSELIAAPFIAPRDQDTRLSRQVIWLPGGDWFDFFTGEYKPGDSWHAIYGSLDDIPVYARAGAIIPLGPLVGWGGTDNPAQLAVHVFPGASNRFELFEDDGVSQFYTEGYYAITPMFQEWSEHHQVFGVGPIVGDPSFIPAQREISLVFHSIFAPENVVIRVNDREIAVQQQFEKDQGTLTLSGIRLSPDERLTVDLATTAPSLLNRDMKIEKILEKMLHAFRLGNNTKDTLLKRAPLIIKDPDELAAFQIALTRSQLRAFLETITSAGVEEIDNIGEQPYLVFWNNQNRQDITYLFSYEWKKAWPPKFYDAEQGVLPKFHVVRSNPEAEHDLPQWMLERGEPPALWQISYGDLLKVVHTRVEQNDPYYRPQEGIF